jgi:hypothetical protein
MTKRHFGELPVYIKKYSELDTSRSAMAFFSNRRLFLCAGHFMAETAFFNRVD